MGNDNLKNAYSVIDSIIQEIVLAEEISIQGICSILDKLNHKLRDGLLKEISFILRQWNKIPANEIRVQVEQLILKANKII